MIVLEAVDLAKVYRGGDGGTITVLDGVNLAGARAARWSRSSARAARARARSFILLGALDQPTRGIGADRRPAARRTRRRSSSPRCGTGRVGFVFQFHHLLREFTALENVMMPLRIAGWDDRARADARRRAARSASDSAGARSTSPSELSGGEQQRTAVARALALDPAVLLADEPSGNLDHANSERLHDLFVELSRDLEIAMVIATHNRSLAARADRTLLLEDGR